MFERIDNLIVGVIRATIIVLGALLALLIWPWLILVAVVACLYAWPGPTILVGLLAFFAGAALLA